MLSKELMGNILAVAAVSGNWSISIQNLEILALKHHLNEECLHFAKEFCEQNRITVYEEETAEETTAEETAEETTEETAEEIAEEGIPETDLEFTEPVAQEEDSALESFINSLVFPKELSGSTNFIRESMYQMKLREAKLISFRFGLLDGTPHTLDETGKKFGITRDRVRCIESRVLRRGCHIRRSKRLQDFLEG